MGKDDENVLRLVYLNSYFQAGIKSPLDDAILKHEHPAIAEYEKVDEIPFDFNRKRLSVVARHGDEYLLITKGEAESVFAICRTVIVEGTPQPFDERQRAQAAETFQKLSADGYRTLGVAVRKVDEAGRLCANGRARHDAGRVRGFPGPAQGGDSCRSQGTEAERRLRGDHDRRQPVRDAEGRARCRTG